MPKPQHSSPFQLLCLGSGKSSFFFSSLTTSTTKVLILTNHPSPSNYVLSYSRDRVINFPQTQDIESASQFVASGIGRKIQTAIVITTNPERGKWWLGQLLSNKNFSKILRENPSLINFILPQSPNPFLEYFEKTGCPVVQFDYYPGTGGVKHGEDGTAQVVAGMKENTNYVVKKSEVLTLEQRNNLGAVINCLSGNQKAIEFNNIRQISLPTNAFLHTVGIVVHIAEELVKKGVIDASILKAKTSQESFATLNSGLEGKPPKEINLLLADSLAGKGFYRQMPHVGPNVLMMEMGNTVCAIRQKLIENNKMPHSFLDEVGADGIHSASHISNHLKEKYAKQYAAANGKDPYSVSFGEFINNNPPYQNPGLVFPTTLDGTINTAHRFFTEDLPTLKEIQQQGSELRIPEEQMRVFSDVIGFCKRLTMGALWL
jgi:hypothetical protein